MEGGGQRDDVRPRTAGAPGRRRGRRRQVRQQPVGALAARRGTRRASHPSSWWPPTGRTTSPAPCGPSRHTHRRPRRSSWSRTIRRRPRPPPSPAWTPRARTTPPPPRRHRGRVDGDPPGLGRGPERRHPPRGGAGGDPPGHERGARGRPRHGAGIHARGPDGRRDRTVRPRVGRHAPLRGCPGGRRRRRRHRGVRDGVPALRLRDAAGRSTSTSSSIATSTSGGASSCGTRPRARPTMRRRGGRSGCRRRSVARHVHRGWTSLPDDERERASKKNFYRVLKRFATRRDLLVAGRPAPGARSRSRRSRADGSCRRP